ncbi:hypothetical protein DRW48_12395 [Paracoccus suum]|uniref:Uncharacterized protein n=1 Tax=Paracoccus suum TaxID=2259340 RepID=A0A344PLX4_9RHOB|nr:hypothetical protein [Paracoccus suum]AXC50379.1 hypothetical protein DRW48_12395 [Paracoccus suum]
MHGITFLQVDFSPGPVPAVPAASDIALEAGASLDLATAFLGASWEMIENFTGRCYRATAAGTVLVEASEPMTYVWPRFPYPAIVTAERWDEGSQTFQPDTCRYMHGRCTFGGGTLYRLTQAPTPAPVSIPECVRRAAANLTLYQLIHQPQRREFRSQTMADVTLTREAVQGLFYGSGAGALLASEVRR